MALARNNDRSPKVAAHGIYPHRMRDSALGTAYTVFQSPELERFEVRLSERLPQRRPDGGDLILGRATGARIEQIGGVPFGASGSPVMVRGRLIGALSQVFAPDFTLVGITPVDDMRQLAHEPGGCADPGVFDEQAKVTAGGMSPWTCRWARRLGIPVWDGSGSGTVSVSVGGRDNGGRANGGSVSGQRGIGHAGLDHSFDHAKGSAPVRSGGPIGAALLVGDVRLGFIGTVTFIEGRRLFAFGHPLLFTGPTCMPLTRAVIYDTAQGPAPTKVGDMLDVVGVVLQDRAAGIFAHLGEEAETIALEFRVRDLDRRRTEVVRSQAAPLPSLVSTLVFIAAVETYVRAMNRVGEGSARWRWQVYVHEEADPQVSEGTTYDPADIAAAAASTILPLIEELLGEGKRIAGVRLEAEVEQARTESPGLEGLIH